MENLYSRQGSSVEFTSAVGMDLEENDTELDFETFRDRQGEGKIHDRNDLFTVNLNFAVNKLFDKLANRINLREEFLSKKTRLAHPTIVEPEKPEKKVKINEA
jgi:hypothetical protein